MKCTSVKLMFGLKTILLCCFACQSTCRGELSLEPTWELPQYRQVRILVTQWIDQQQLTNAEAQLAFSLWPNAELRSTTGPELLDRVIETFAVGDVRIQELLRTCNSNDSFLAPPDASWLNDPTLTKLEKDNLKLYFGRWLTQHGYYDEAVEILAGLTHEEVMDPSSLFFYQAVAFQQLVEPEKARVAITLLLEQEENLPERFQQIAQMLDKDLSGLKDESLDHIARRMNDVRRRLDIGRAGKQVQVVEDGVLNSLDRLIGKLEQQQQQLQQGSMPGGGQQSQQPMQDSVLPSMRAKMEVDEKDIGNKSGWGDLPAKEREEALQQIGRDFPAHYREVIEQYFRELADESNKTPSR